MPIYNFPPPRQRLDVFFADMFGEMRTAPPEAYGGFLMRAEEEFRRTGYRESTGGGAYDNILIVRLDLIGDMIMTSGFIREVRANFPQARITLIASPTVRPVVELCPYINEILSFDVQRLFGNPVEVLEQIAVFCRDNLWEKKFSVAFSPRWYSDTLPTLLLIWLSGARERIGYGSYPYQSWLGEPPPQAAAQDNFFLTKNVVTPQSMVSDADRNFYLLAAVGLKVNATNMELWFDSEDFRRAKQFLEDLPPTSQKVLLGLSASDNNRKYPAEKYLVALRELVKRDLVFIILGGKSEEDYANVIEQNLPPGKVLNLAGKTTLRETEAVISLADVYLGHDTGVLHMAATQSVPCVVLYREAQDRENYLPPLFSGYRRFPPWQTKSVILRPAHPLGDCATSPPVFGWCRHFNEPHCIAQIPPQAIIEAFDKLLSVIQ